MRLVAPSLTHLEEMMSWFADQDTLFAWAGPNFRFPYTLASFETDLRLNELASYSLVDNADNFLAFGQYYSRLGKCHLGRLVVNPKHRGKGIAQKLMLLLVETGQLNLKTNSSSLFVLSDNLPAIKSYQSFGFKCAEYPDEIAISDCLYMIKS